MESRPERCGATEYFGKARDLWAVEPTVRGVVDGVSSELDGYKGRLTTDTFERAKRLKGLGNAIVPQIACLIFKLIKERLDIWD